MSNNIFFKFDNFKNLYITSSTFDIQANVDNLQAQLNTDIDCVAYIDVSLEYFNNVFSYSVKNTNVNTDISAIIYSGVSGDINYYVSFINPWDLSNNKYFTTSTGDTWYSLFTWFNPAFARCPPRSMKIDDITIDNRIVHSAYPINGNIVPRVIQSSTPTSGYTMYVDTSDPNNVNYSSEIAVLQNDQIYMENEKTIEIGPGKKQYYTNCLVIRKLLQGLPISVGIIPVELFVPLKQIRNSADLYLYNNNLAGNAVSFYIDISNNTRFFYDKDPSSNPLAWYPETHTTQQRIERVLSSDLLIDEYIRYVSLCLTNNPNNVGLIANYPEIQNHIITFCGSDTGGVVMSRLKQKLIDLDVSTNTIHIGRGQDASGNYYTNNLYDINSNITRNLLIQSNMLGRGYDITADDIAKGTRVPFTFLKGDKISFTFTINPPEFSSATDASYNIPGWRDYQEILIKPRKYRIFANMVN